MGGRNRQGGHPSEGFHIKHPCIYIVSYRTAHARECANCGSIADHGTKEKKVVKMLSLFLLFSFALTVHSHSCSKLDAQVLILGGGMTGVAAANRLTELGITDFIILEGQDRLGGRVRVEQLPSGRNVNVGANWIQGVDQAEPRLHPVFDLAEKCGGLEGIYSDYDNLIVYDSSGTDISDSDALRYDQFSAAVDAASSARTERQLNGMSDITAREAFTDANWTSSSPEDGFVEWFGFDYCIAETPDVSSLFDSIDLPTYTAFLQDSENDVGDYFITDERGYVYLIDCLLSNFSSTPSSPSSDERIKLETEVTGIEYSDDCVCASVLQDSTATRYCASYAIVTFSVGVLQDEDLFTPPLPEAKAENLDLIAMANFLIIYAVYEETFWDRDAEYIGRADTERGYFPVIQPLDKTHGINGLAFTLTGEISKQVASQSTDTISQEITTVLRSIYGDSVTEPSTILFRDWSTFLGAFSFARPGANRTELTIPEGNMYLAGEGTSPDYSGFVHGAYLSGIDTANLIAEKIASAGYKLVSNVLLVTSVTLCAAMLK